jgi:hypothetical protein
MRPRNEVTLAGGIPAPLKPAAANQGTTVEVRDLFFATPARLKFLKSDRAETAAITETVRRIAIAFPSVRFTLSGPDRSTLDLPINRRGQAGAHRPGAGRRIRRQHHRGGRDLREDVGLDRPYRAANLEQGKLAVAVCLRQRPAGTGQANPFGNSRRLLRYLAARTLPGGGALDHARSGAGGCQCAPGQVRCAVSRSRSCPRADCRRHPAGAACGRRPRLTIGRTDLAEVFRSHAICEHGVPSRRRLTTVPPGSRLKAAGQMRLIAARRLDRRIFKRFRRNRPGRNSRQCTPSARNGPDRNQPPIATHPLGAARAQVHENYISPRRVTGW